MQKIFPNVTGWNLVRKKFNFPADFIKPYNLVLVAFKRYHQDDVDTWIPTASAIKNSNHEFTFYEFPTLYKMPRLRQFFLNEGMRLGIPDKSAHLVTITLYLEKEKFRSHLGIPNENEIVVFLIDKSGNILWEKYGKFQNVYKDEILNIISKSGK